MSNIRPFANGEEYRQWLSVNCRNCAKWDAETASEEACAIDDALGDALLGTGEVTRTIAKRAGLPFTDWNQTCPERVSKLIGASA